MFWKRRKKKEQEVNLLDLTPVRLLQFETADDGLVTLLKPRFTNRFLVKYVQPQFSRPNFRVTLDRFGSVMTRCLEN